MPSIVKAARIIGHRLVLRNAGETDASFILQLRTNAGRSQFLSTTSARLSDQVDWMQRYQADASQAYFIIERMDGQPIGTVRLYDARGRSFCWGSWILRPDEPFYHAIESALMVYSYALSLGFESAHFEVAKNNTGVCRFHDNFGARRTGELGDQYVYLIGYEQINASLDRYRRFLPHGIDVSK